MNNETKFDFFTRNESLVEVIESLFTPKGYGISAVIKVIIGAMSIGWLADSLLPIIHGVALRIFESPNASKVNFSDNFRQLIIPLSWFIIFIAFLFIFRRQKIKIGKYLARPSYPHRGLIISLSPYSSRDLPLADLEKQIDNGRLDIEKFYNSANWGQLAITIEHHSNLLQKCWICTTSKSTDQFPIAEKLIKYILKESNGREIICENIKLNDENDISEMARKVSRIYMQLGEEMYSIKSSDVISNYTGGTAAMSGGMIMATLNKHRKIEYVTQKYFGKLSTDLINENNESSVIVSSETNIETVAKLN